MRIKIVPLGEIQKSVLEKVRNGLRSTFQMVGTITKPMKIPQSAFNQFRNQYRSDQILDFLQNNYKGRVLGITEEDLYTEGLNFVFGQAKMGNNICVVSICRLNPTFFHQPKDEKLLEERSVKECIHEVGHTLGLTHCDKKGCVMNFSNTVSEVDKKTRNLCESCRSKVS